MGSAVVVHIHCGCSLFLHHGCYYFVSSFVIVVGWDWEVGLGGLIGTPGCWSLVVGAF